MSSDASAARGLSARILRVLRWMERRFRTRSPRAERILLILAAALFVVAGVVGYLTLPDVAGPVQWELLAAVAFVGAPATMLFISLEYLVGARVLGIRVSFLSSLRISVLSSAANLLPLPGSVIVRTRGLRQAGSSYGGALSTLAAVGVLWVGTAALITGAALSTTRLALGLILLLVGAAMTVAGHLVVRVFAGRGSSLGLTLRIVAVETGATVVGIARIYVVVRALGLPITIPQATALQFAGVVATASGIFPSGLGLREALSGAVSPLVGLPASVGLFSSTINRLLDKLVLLPATLVIYVRSRRAGPGSPAAGEPGRGDLEKHGMGAHGSTEV